MNQGIWDYNIPTQEGYCSQMVYKILGYEDGEFPASKESFMSLIHPDELGIIKEQIKKFTKNHESYSFEVRVKKKGWKLVLDPSQRQSNRNR